MPTLYLEPCESPLARAVSTFDAMNGGRFWFFVFVCLFLSFFSLIDLIYTLFSVLLHYTMPIRFASCLFVHHCTQSGGGLCLKKETHMYKKANKIGNQCKHSTEGTLIDGMARTWLIER